MLETSELQPLTLQDRGEAGTLDLSTPEGLKQFKKEFIANAAKGRGIDRLKYFQDLLILDTNGILEKDQGLQAAVVQSGQDPLIWQGVYTGCEESVNILQNPDASPEQQQIARQNLQAYFRITEITQMDISPADLDPAVPQIVLQVWQDTWNGLNYWRSFLQEEAVPSSPPSATPAVAAPEAPPVAPPTPPIPEAVPTPEPVVSPARIAEEETIQKIIYGPNPESLTPEQLREFKDVQYNCQRAFKHLQALETMQGDGQREERLAAIDMAIYVAKSALAKSQGQFDELARVAQQILDYLKPFRLEKFHADYERDLDVNELFKHTPQGGFIRIEGTLDEVSDLTDASIESARQDLHRAREKHYGQVLSCDQLISSAQEAMNIVAEQQIMNLWWQEAGIMLDYASRKNPSPQQLQAIADLAALFSEKEQVQQAHRAAKEREYTIEVGQKYQIRGEEYTVTRKLGGGLFGEVYLASSPQGELVVKVAQKNIDDKLMREFEMEFETLIRLEDYQLKHGLIVNGEFLTPRYLGSGETPGGRRFFAMTVAKGQPLDELYLYNLITPLEGVPIIRQACPVFEALHEGVGRCNKDFQPKNIFWDKETGLITVIDWNMLDEKTPSNIQRDIASLGMVLFRIVTGRSWDKSRPIREQTTGITQATLKEIIETAIEPAAGQEYLSAKQLGEALASVELVKKNTPPVADEPVPVPPGWGRPAIAQPTVLSQPAPLTLAETSREGSAPAGPAVPAQLPAPDLTSPERKDAHTLPTKTLDKQVRRTAQVLVGGSPKEIDQAIERLALEHPDVDALTLAELVAREVENPHTLAARFNLLVQQILKKFKRS